MIQNGELMIIDMDTMAVGNPIFELAGIYCSYIAFEEYEPGNNKRILKLDSDVAKRLFYDTALLYYEGLDRKQMEENMDLIKLIGYLHMLYWIRTYRPEDEAFFGFEYQRFRECLARISEVNS